MHYKKYYLNIICNKTYTKYNKSKMIGQSNERQDMWNYYMTTLDTGNS